MVRAEIRRLYAAGVRYLFPVHLTDNLFGGAALYEPLFETATQYLFGRRPFMAEAAPKESGINYVHDPDSGLIQKAFQQLTLGFQTTILPQPPTTSGHRNSRGLTPLGQVLIEECMALGMLIDIDHMSERTVQGCLSVTDPQKYPVCSGHNNVRGDPSQGVTSERAHSATIAQRVFDGGGSWGVGMAAGLESFCTSVRRLRSLAPSAAAAFGSDASGLERLPRPRFTGGPLDATGRANAGMVVYRDLPGAPPDALERFRFGNRGWDYSLDGCAHAGLLPDLVEEIVSSGLLTDNEVNSLFNAAESLARTWEVAEQSATSASWTGWHYLSEQGNKAKAIAVAVHSDGRGCTR